MAIRKYAGDKITGLSSDTKPTNVSDGATFYETDTNKIYIKVSGSWVESTSTTANLALATAQSAFAQANTGGDISPAFNQANLALATAQSAFAQANTGGSSSSFTSNVVISVADDTNAALRITQTGTADAIRIEDDTNPDATPFVVDATGNVGIGKSPISRLTVYHPSSSVITVQGDAASVFSAQRFSTDINSATVQFIKARGNVAFPAAVASSDVIGQVNFLANTSTQNRQLASIRGYVDTYTSDTDVSSYLNFWTSPAGGIAVTERMRIDATGNVLINRTDSTVGQGVKFDVAGAINASAVFVNGISVVSNTFDDINITGNILKSGLPFLFQRANAVVFTASGTYTPTTNVEYALVIATGAGGTGGGSDTDGTAGAGGTGGGAGGTAIKVYPYTHLINADITIGVRGAVGSATNGTSGATGGNTSFTANATNGGTSLTANGGSAGIGSAVVATQQATAGAPGGAASGGDINIVGGSGDSGGGSDSTNFGKGGQGGASFWGGGGYGGIVTSTGNMTGGDASLTTYGAGGGGGASSDNGTGANGGLSANGVVFILEFTA